jgi:hypothetical protein
MTVHQLQRALLVSLTLAGTSCVEGVTQVAGTGALYHTRCSSDMLLQDGAYKATCTPEDCTAGYAAGPISHVVVALDPGRKVIGYAERVCIQDLARSSGLFNPMLVEPSTLEPASDEP